jgi:hypothetical protein
MYRNNARNATSFSRQTHFASKKAREPCLNNWRTHAGTARLHHEKKAARLATDGLWIFCGRSSAYGICTFTIPCVPSVNVARYTTPPAPLWLRVCDGDAAMFSSTLNAFTVLPPIVVTPSRTSNRTLP